MTLFAVAPAAGHSTRMGRPKLLLPLGGRCAIERVVEALIAGGVHHVVVVVGPHVPKVGMRVEAAGARVCSLPAATADMRATVEEGLNWLEAHFHPRDDDGWLLAPGDHPALDGEVVRQLAAAYDEGSHSIVVPTFAGRRGHPTLLAWRHVAGIRAHSAGQGLNAYLRAQADAIREVPVANDDILCDLNTPEDYERLCARFNLR